MTNLTKLALANALRKLLNERPLSRITIRDLVAEAHVNRQTFYYHFQDIYELVFWALEQGITDYLEREHIGRTDIYEYTYALFGYFRENARVVRNAYDSVNRIQYESLFHEHAYPYILTFLKKREAAKNVSEDDLAFIATFFTQALTGFFLKWVESGLPDEHRVQLEKYCVLMEGGADTILEKFQKA